MSTLEDARRYCREKRAPSIQMCDALESRIAELEAALGRVVLLGSEMNYEKTRRIAELEEASRADRSLARDRVAELEATIAVAEDASNKDEVLITDQALHIAELETVLREMYADVDGDLISWSLRISAALGEKPG